MSGELPPTWAVAHIRELCEVPKEKGCEGVAPYLEIGNVDIKRKNYTLSDKPSVKGCRTAKQNDVLVSRVRPNRGAITWIREKELQISSAFTVLRNRGALTKKYLWLYLAWNREYLNYLSENCTGTMYPTTSNDVVVDFEVPVAPLPEQKRIVTKLETLLGKVETCRKWLEKIPALLKRFRQSVLAAACSGRLTEDWQAQNNGQPWEKETIGELEVFIGSGMTPKGGKSVYVSSGIPFIKSQNVLPTGLVLDDVAYVTPELHQQMLRTHIRPSDVLLNITGASIGRSTVVPDDFSDGNVNQHVCIIRVKSCLLPKFLSMFLNSPIGQDMIFETQVGVTREGLNYKQLRSFRVPLPPLAEQEEIIRRVESLFALADQIEARYTKAKSHVDKLTQSILAKAFRGELASQNPSDEPASALLERIAGLMSNQRSGRKKRSIAKKETNPHVS